MTELIARLYSMPVSEHPAKPLDDLPGVYAELAITAPDGCEWHDWKQQPSGDFVILWRKKEG